MIHWMNWLPVMAAGAIAGGSCGLLGVHVVGMRIPFVAVCVSHAALAGAVFGALAGVSAEHLYWPALAAAVAVALLLGFLDCRGVQIDTNVLIGALFALSMGLAFLGIGLFGILGKSDNDVRNLLWGNLTFCRWSDVRGMATVLAIQILFVSLLAKELRAILFSRSEAAAMGIAATAVWIGFLLLTSVVLSAHFQTVGGLLIYSLLINPAAAAFLLVRGHEKVMVAATLLGAVSGFGGFVIAALTDLPTGAVIVITSSILLMVAALASGWIRQNTPEAIGNTSERPDTSQQAR